MTSADRHSGLSSAPATRRNREPILAVLQRVLPEAGKVLEIASGSGEHVTFFAPHFPDLVWQPSDPHPGSRASIAAWTAELETQNVLPPLDIDAAAADWGAVEDAAVAAILCINMIHIAPWDAGRGLLAGAGRLLAPRGLLYLYGPFQRGGRHTAPSNAAFDESLRAQNPDWGVRDLDMVAAEAHGQGLDLAEVVDMPANNLSVILRKR